MHFLCFQLSPIQPLGAATQFCLALQPLTLCQSPRKSVICSSKNSSRKPTGRMFPLLYFFSYSSSLSQNPSIPLSKSFSSFNKLCYLNSFGSSWPVTPTHYCTSLLSPKASGCLMGKKIVTASECYKNTHSSLSHVLDICQPLHTLCQVSCITSSALTQEF